MLHLFNKVYLEFDDKIEINFDRVVISEKYGTQMLQVLDQVAYGKLITFGKIYEEVVDDDFVGFISVLKSFGETSNKKIIVYCDKSAYKKFITQWFKTILPNLDFAEFKTLVDHTIYNQRIVSNTQLSSVYSVNLNSMWESLDGIEEIWNTTSPANRNLLKNIELNYSYEFLVSTYLSGDQSHKEQLKKTLHMFLRRWFKEMFADNRQMVLLNITNHKFLSAFNIDPSLVDITKLDPLSGIEQLESYSDDEIWERDENAYGECKLEGLNDEKAVKLMNTLLNIFEKFEGMQINQTVFGIKNYVTMACAETISDEKMDELLNYIVNNPFDTALVPRFDFQNVNFTLMQYFLSKKYNEKDLSKYRLL
jgi:hypothetical protein